MYVRLETNSKNIPINCGPPLGLQQKGEKGRTDCVHAGHNLNVLPEDTLVVDMLHNMSRHNLSMRGTCIHSKVMHTMSIHNMFMHKMCVHNMHVRDMSMHNSVMCNTFMRKHSCMCTHVQILQVTEHTQWCSCRACTVV